VIRFLHHRHRTGRLVVAVLMVTNGVLIGVTAAVIADRGVPRRSTPAAAVPGPPAAVRPTGAVPVGEGDPFVSVPAYDAAAHAGAHAANPAAATTSTTPSTVPPRTAPAVPAASPTTSPPPTTVAEMPTTTTPTTTPPTSTTSALSAG
jgi:hypothetical protein